MTLTLSLDSLLINYVRTLTLGSDSKVLVRILGVENGRHGGDLKNNEELFNLTWQLYFPIVCGISQFNWRYRGRTGVVEVSVFLNYGVGVG